MSFGALSNNVIKALNKGAKIGGFSDNSEEGSISSYHLQYGGDLVWQIGTGYFGCRDKQGKFSAENFAKIAQLPSIKMIEIKSSPALNPVMVASFHTKTVNAAMEIIASAGLEYETELNRSHLYWRTSRSAIKRYDEIYSYPAEGCFLGSEYSKSFAQEMCESYADSFLPKRYVVKSGAGWPNWTRKNKRIF